MHLSKASPPLAKVCLDQQGFIINQHLLKFQQAELFVCYFNYYKVRGAVEGLSGAPRLRNQWILQLCLPPEFHVIPEEFWLLLEMMHFRFFSLVEEDLCFHTILLPSC